LPRKRLKEKRTGPTEEEKEEIFIEQEISETES